MQDSSGSLQLESCEFYHSMDLPGHGEVEGQWDLRRGVVDYLGNVDLAGKRVLDVGTSSGFLCFQMERMGASVVAFDLSPEQDWDFIPYGGAANPDRRAAMKAHIERIRRGWELAHASFGSRARLVRGSVYDLPVDEIGEVDVALFGSILLHLRDPFLALQRAGRIATESVIVTDVMPPAQRPTGGLVLRLLMRFCHRITVRNAPTMTFIPDPPRATNDLT
ncbi:methyltransferase domain-containing protein [Candidatus Fermentibacterales bacterium]|nr:methyltransferase domain-containing protein [Candidatus Fermentibacterales bacterium]